MNRLIRPAATTRQHRGLRSYHWSLGQTLMVAALLLLNWVVLTLLYDRIQDFWQAVLTWAWPRLGIDSTAAVAQDHVSLLGYSWRVVGLQLNAAAPTAWQALASLVILVLVFLATFLVPRRHLPWIYFVRAVAVLCAMSAMAYLWFPSLMHTNVSGYFNDLMQIGAIYLFLVPLLHALLLYIFPLGVPEKLVATWVALMFVIVSVPLHVGALAWLVAHTSTLVMLPIYMLATFLPPVIAQLGIYAYFASRARVSERRGVPRRRDALAAG